MLIISSTATRHKTTKVINTLLNEGSKGRINEKKNEKKKNIIPQNLEAIMIDSGSMHVNRCIAFCCVSYSLHLSFFFFTLDNKIVLNERQNFILRQMIFSSVINKRHMHKPNSTKYSHFQKFQGNRSK